MCGICGWYGPTTAEDEEALLDMNAAQFHRGPDEQGSVLLKFAAMAMSRLSIIDVAGGQQPMWNEDRSTCIVYNGEIYNFRDLRPELVERGHAFRTLSDTEVVLHAFEEWGPACVRRFNGMFAFAIWDGKTGMLMLARDRVGEKPLYYARMGDRLLFASEIKAILADCRFERRVNPQGLVNYLAFGHAVAPQTMFEGIQKLLPGHYVLVSPAGVKITQYWDVGSESRPGITAGSDAEDIARQVRALLTDSVRRRMIADVPVGAFLSGGVDSSAVVALMRQEATGPVKTFSLGFAEGGAYDELSDARRVARFLGTEHHELQVAHVDLISILRTLVYHYDEPFGDAAGFPIYLLSQFARRHVKVVLTGDGGDELFGGYRRYAADQFARPYQVLPSVFSTRVIPGLVSRVPRLRRIKKTLHTLPVREPAERYANWLVLFTSEMRADLLAPALYKRVQDYDPVGPYRKYYEVARQKQADHLNRLMYIDVKTWLADAYMEKTDKATMANSLEARLPLLDHRLVELAFQIPSRLKVRGWSTKRILKQAVKPLVPAEVLHKPKHGFAVPTDPWFRGSLKQFTFDVLLDPVTRARGYFNARVVERLWKQHAEGREVWDTHLWLLLNFELWYRAFMDGQRI